jgi:hypothetical protein
VWLSVGSSASRQDNFVTLLHVVYRSVNDRYPKRDSFRYFLFLGEGRLTLLLNSGLSDLFAGSQQISVRMYEIISCYMVPRSTNPIEEIVACNRCNHTQSTGVKINCLCKAVRIERSTPAAALVSLVVGYRPSTDQQPDPPPQKTVRCWTARLATQNPVFIFKKSLYLNYNAGTRRESFTIPRQGI